MKDLFIQLTLESIIQAKLGPCRGDLGDGAHTVGRAVPEPRQPSPQAPHGWGAGRAPGPAAPRPFRAAACFAVARSGASESSRFADSPWVCVQPGGRGTRGRTRPLGTNTWRQRIRELGTPLAPKCSYGDKGVTGVRWVLKEYEEEEKWLLGSTRFS